MAKVNVAYHMLVRARLLAWFGKKTRHKHRRLRAVKDIVCGICNKPAPHTKICMMRDSITYDDVMDKPFSACDGRDLQSGAQMNTDELYLYKGRVGQRPGPYAPPLEIERALAMSPLELPPLVRFE